MKLFAEAEGLRERGELEGALDLCVQALQLLPGYASGHIVFGEVLRDQGQLELAEREWRHALTLHAEHPRAHLRLAQLYLGRGEAERAIAELDLSLLYSPGSSEAAALLSTAQSEETATSPRSAEQLLALLEEQPGVEASAVVDGTGRVRHGGAGVGAEAAGLAARLLVGVQPLVRRLQAGRLLSVSIRARSGGVLCVAAEAYGLVAALESSADGPEIARVLTARAPAPEGARAG